MKQTEEFISLFTVLPTSLSLHAFGRLKEYLTRRGRKIENFDLMIGACAAANKLVLVTDNIKHMDRLPDITIENWKIDWPK